MRNIDQINESNNVPQFELRFDRGTLIVKSNCNTDLSSVFPWIKWDERSRCYRCHAYKYRNLVRYFFLSKIFYSDFTSKYNKLELTLQTAFKPHDYQAEALESWEKAKRGVAVLPTGTGKSFLAALVMEQVKRSTLVLAPTIDLINQWHKNMEEWFGCPIGILGGGSNEILDITVSTYDSARNFADRIGDRFGLIIFDECHHLPSPAYAEMARSYIAPYRLGLSATPNEEDDRAALLADVLGNIVYTKQIQHLSGDFLSPYTIETVEVELSEKERDEYDYHRDIYMSYRDKVPVSFGQARSWEQFVMRCYRSAEGRQALKSFYRQKEIAVMAEEKLRFLADIMKEHKNERILVFTNDNKTAFKISSLFLLPVITHETKAKERKQILENFRNGTWPFLVNSRVLNEGVDVPEANIAVVFSGTSTVWEHVQRLGRILRKKDDKTAILYELITVNTGEVYTSRKRREHGAYENF